MSKETNRKTVAFNEDEKYLLDFSMHQEDKFATYIKKLIKKDYQNRNETIDDKIDKKIQEYFNKYLEVHNLELKEKATDKQVKLEFDAEDKTSLIKFMNGNS